jgi:hypothetical protein
MTGIVRKFVVQEHELGLLFRRGEFQGLLRPGTHWRLDPLQRLSMEAVEINAPAFRHRLQDFLVKSWPRSVRERFEVIETQRDQVAVVYLNGRLQQVLGPRQRALYPKGVAEVATTVIDVAEPCRVGGPIARAVTAEA